MSHPTPRLLAATRGGSGIRLVARLARLSCVATFVAHDDRVRLVRHTWGVGGVARLVSATRPTLSGSVGLCRTKMSRAAQLVRLAVAVESAPDSSTRRLLGLSVGRRCHGRHDSSDSPSVESAPDSSTRRLLDSEFRVQSLFEQNNSSTPRFIVIFGSPGDRIRAAYPLGKFDESDAAPFKCVSGRRLSVL